MGRFQTLIDKQNVSNAWLCAGDAPATCLGIDLVGKVLAVGNVLGRTSIYILETSEQLCELRCVCLFLCACVYV